MASEIEAAAERWGKLDSDTFGGGPYGDERDEQQWEDERNLARWALARLAADRAEREERARPIDDDYFLSKTRGVNSIFRQCRVTGDIELTAGVVIRGVTKRGDLDDLLRVLKGGAE